MGAIIGFIIGFVVGQVILICLAVSYDSKDSDEPISKDDWKKGV